MFSLRTIMPLVAVIVFVGVQVPSATARPTTPPLFLASQLANASAQMGPEANLPPSVQFLVAPAPSDTVFYEVPFSWMGSDLDGTVSLYRYATDPPPSSDTSWVETSATLRILFFAARTCPEPLPPSGPIRFAEPHTLVVKAVDNDGLESARESRPFFAFTIAPDVRITSPVPNPATYVTTSTNPTFQWEGTDWDGVFSNRPVRYAFRMFSSHNPDFPTGPDFISLCLANPDTLRRLYAPAFAGWNFVGGDTTQFHFRNLNPQTSYLFCVVGFDEAGAYSARFGRALNMIWIVPDLTVGVEDGFASSHLQLEQPYPNPADAATAVDFALPRDAWVALQVFDVNGRRVRTLASGWTQAGARRASWDLADDAGRRVHAGLYLVRLDALGTTVARKVVVKR